MNSIAKTSSILFQDRLIRLAPAPAMPAARRDVASRIDTAAERAAFAEFVELTMTGLVLTAVLLFGAGLLHFGVPACTARFWAMTVLYALAGLGGLATGALAVKAGLHLVRCFGPARG